MVNHIDLGSNNDERKRNVASMIRNGSITLGGYERANIYGLLNCSSGRRMNIENRVFFKDENEASASGYRPCGNCLPEKYQVWKQAQKP